MGVTVMDVGTLRDRRSEGSKGPFWNVSIVMSVQIHTLLFYVKLG